MFLFHLAAVMDVNNCEMEFLHAQRKHGMHILIHCTIQLFENS